MADGRPRVLVVEDNALIAMMTQELVEQCGCSVVGPFSSVEEALPAVREIALDGAVLDINLGDERVWPLAEFLEQREVPFMFLSAYTTMAVPERYRKRPLVSKPITLDGLSTILKGIGTVHA